MSQTPREERAAKNTDRELWREKEGDYYSPSIHVTEGGGIGMNVGGHVVVMPIQKWHALALRESAPAAAPASESYPSNEDLDAAVGVAGPSELAFREILRMHWLHVIDCNHLDKTDTAHCACGKWSSEPQSSVGAALEKWIDHVCAIAASKNE